MISPVSQVNYKELILPKLSESQKENITTTMLKDKIKKEYQLTDLQAEKEVLNILNDRVKRGLPIIKEFKGYKIIIHI
jgi:hypothetical protein